MKLKHTLSLLTLAVCAAGSSGALAQTGTITFTGRIISAACTASVNGQTGPNFTVDLPSVNVADLNAAGVAGETPFTFDLTECKVTPSTTKAWVHFSGGDTVTAAGATQGNLKNSLTGQDAATNVVLRLKDGTTNSEIKADAAPVGATTNPNTGVYGTEYAFNGTSPAMTATLPYKVEYYTPGNNATPGDVKSDVTYNVIYH